jgi:hypothetical protein
VKAHLSQLVGEMLEFNEIAEALEYRQCLRLQEAPQSLADGG